MSGIDKVNAIASALEELNFPQRGHIIKKYIEDPDFDMEVTVSNMNVPAVADCRFVAKQFGVMFYVDESFDLGIFAV